MSADNWFIARDKKKLGPFTTVQMKQMAQAGQLLPIDIVIKDGTTKWMPASQAQEFFPASGSLPPLITPVAPASSSPSPADAVALPPPASVTAQALGKLLGMIPIRIAPPIIGMTAVVLLALLAGFFCGSFLVFFFSFLHNAGAVACIVLTVRLQKSLYALLAALLTMTAWGWLCFTAVWTVVSILGLLVGIAVGIWALFAFFSPEGRRQFSDPSLPAPLERLPFPALAGVLGGASLTLILGIGMVLWLTTGSKTGGGRSGNDGGKVSGKNGKDGGEVKVDLPDFSKVDYSFDFSKVDYTKGPQGQKLETWVGDGGLTNAQQYQGPEGKPLFHGKVVKTLGGFKVSESLFLPVINTVSKPNGIPTGK